MATICTQLSLSRGVRVVRIELGSGFSTIVSSFRVTGNDTFYLNNNNNKCIIHAINQTDIFEKEQFTEFILYAIFGNIMFYLKNINNLLYVINRNKIS